MIPNGMSREPLRLFFTKHFLVSLVFGGDTSNGCCRNSFQVNDDPPKEVVIPFLFSRDVSLSGYEDGFFCIVSSQYYWELCVINPSLFPIYFGLCSSKPWIPEDSLLLPKFGKIESEVGMIGSCLNLQVGIIT